MFSTSSQKSCWSFRTQADIDECRAAANRAHVARYRALLDEEEEVGDGDSGADGETAAGKKHPNAIADFLTPAEEVMFCRVVMEPGLRFADEFQPPMWPPVRWTAFAYFKRIYLRQSAMEFSPRQMLMVSYWLAAKIEEFAISIDNFVGNLRTGTPQSNVEMILALEPELMRRLDYQLIVHTPYRPFEGHLLDMKTRGVLSPVAEINQENQPEEPEKNPSHPVDCLRPHGMAFLTKALLGDVMFLHSPSQIALAAVKYALQQTYDEPNAAETFHRWLVELSEDKQQHAEQLIHLADEILQKVEKQASIPVDEQQQRERLKSRIEAVGRLQAELDPILRKRELERSKQRRQQRKQQSSGFESDDDLEEYDDEDEGI